MHLYLLMTGQYFPVLPLAIQHWCRSPTILIGTDSPGSHRDHRCLRLLGLVLTLKVLSLLKYISYSSYPQLLYHFNSLYCHFCPFTDTFHTPVLWRQTLVKLLLSQAANIMLIVLVLYHLSDCVGHTCQEPCLPRVTLYSEMFDMQ